MLAASKNYLTAGTSDCRAQNMPNIVTSNHDDKNNQLLFNILILR